MLLGHDAFGLYSFGCMEHRTAEAATNEVHADCSVLEA